MTPHRWRQIKAVFDEAVECDPAERSEFLGARCEGDQELRQMVESLLRSDGEAGSLLQSPMWEGARRSGDSTLPLLTPGAQLGPYRVESLLGAGGMGQVYRARDTRLGRLVALKILNAQFSGRLEREARAISMPNHPHICTLYDVGPNYLVMEFVEGETLEAPLRKGRMPIELVIRYGTQIASALAAAHAKGIVHRDLKPRNIMIAPSGVKVLDFGLAKLPPASGAAGEAPSEHTAPGMVMGTAPYMSPEQARGDATDHRSDIFSLGSVLYEMACGARPFRGDTVIETMNAILRDEPTDLANLAATLPAGFTRIVSHCMEKNADDRFQSARDLAFALDATIQITSPGAPGQVVAGRDRRWPYAAIGAAAAGVLLAALYVAASRGNPPAPSFHRLTFRRGNVPAARFAPDGKTVVYSAFWDGGPSRVFAARAESPESRDLGITDAALLSVSPTGELAVLRNPSGDFDPQGTLARVPMFGGAPRDVVENVHSAEWSPDGQNMAIVRESESGAQLEFPQGQVLFRTAGWITSPRFSKDGKEIAFVEHPVRNDDGGYIGIATVSGEYRRVSGPWVSIWGLSWMARTGEIWFAAANVGDRREIQAVTNSGRVRTVSSQAAPLHMLDASQDGQVLLTVDEWRTRLFFSGPNAKAPRDLSWLDWSGLTDISADGGTVAFFETGEGAGQLSAAYLRKTDGSPAVKLGNGDWPRLSPDGTKVAAVQAELPRREILIFPTGPGSVQRLTSPGFTFTRAYWMPNQAGLLLIAGTPGHGLGLYSMNLSGGAPRAVTTEGVTAAHVVVSPDGRRAAVTSAADQVLIYPLDGGQPEICRAIQSGERPIQWSSSGEFLYVYRRNGLPATIYRVDLRNWRRTLWKEIMPSDPAGVNGINAAAITPDGKYIAYSTLQMLSELSLVGGLR